MFLYVQMKNFKKQHNLKILYQRSLKLSLHFVFEMHKLKLY